MINWCKMVKRNKMQSLGDRIKKNYENRNKHYLTRRTPVIIRLDGKNFSNWTRGCDKPFDSMLMSAMVRSAFSVCERIQGFKLAYVQSDEVSILVRDDDTLETCAWFDYNQSKLESVTASMMTAHFNAGTKRTTGLAYFDSRAFNVPESEIVNYFLWRAKDWERNSLQMYCSSIFSHKELMNKSKYEQHEMLYSVDKNWATDLSSWEKNGCFIDRDGKRHCDVLPSYDSINAIYLASL